MNTAEESVQLRFAFVSVERPWFRDADGTPSKDRVVVCQAAPTTVRAWGATREEAVRNLRRAVLFDLRMSGQQPLDWYHNFESSMDAKSRQEYEKLVAEAWSRSGVHDFDLSQHNLTIGDQPVSVQLIGLQTNRTTLDPACELGVIGA